MTWQSEIFELKGAGIELDDPKSPALDNQPCVIREYPPQGPFATFAAKALASTSEIAAAATSH